MVNIPPANAGDVRDTGSSPRSGRLTGEGNGNPLQCSCLENPMDRGAWWAAIYGVAQSQTQLKRLSSSRIKKLIVNFKKTIFMYVRASLVAQTIKNLPAMQETGVRSLGWEDLLEKAMAPHSSTLA